MTPWLRYPQSSLCASWCNSFFLFMLCSDCHGKKIFASKFFISLCFFHQKDMISFPVYVQHVFFTSSAVNQIFLLLSVFLDKVKSFFLMNLIIIYKKKKKSVLLIPIPSFQNKGPNTETSTAHVTKTLSRCSELKGRLLWQRRLVWRGN